MDKVTQINVEGHNYGFVAGNAIKAVCGAASADYIKTVLMPEGANVEEGMIIAVTFSNGNSAGYAEVQDAYSSDGETFYWDELLTDSITLPPQGCYEMTLDAGEHYFYTAYPRLSFGGNSYPVCMSNGKPVGGEIWDSGDIVIFLFLDNKMLSLISKGGSGGVGNPLGTILALHSNAVPYGYLPCNGVAFDENQYPALYALLGDNHTPYSYDKSRLGEWEAITISTSSASPTVMPFDGFITGKVASQVGTMAYIYINGTAFSVIATADAVYYRFTLPVKKGDEVYFDTASGQVSYTDVFAAYYTHFNVIKATSGLEETQQDYVLQSLLEADNYSTDEVATGKKWIDGKMIYRKVFYSATNWANGTTIGTISNLGMVIKIRDITRATNNFYYENLGIVGSDSQKTNVRATDGAVIVDRSGIFSNSLPSTVIIEYTKN